MGSLLCREYTYKAIAASCYSIYIKALNLILMLLQIVGGDQSPWPATSRLVLMHLKSRGVYTWLRFSGWEEIVGHGPLSFRGFGLSFPSCCNVFSFFLCLLVQLIHL